MMKLLKKHTDWKGILLRFSSKQVSQCVFFSQGRWIKINFTIQPGGKAITAKSMFLKTLIPVRCI